MSTSQPPVNWRQVDNRQDAQGPASLPFEGFFLHWFSTKKVFVVIVSKSLQGIVTHGVLSGSALQVGYPPTPYVGRAGILQV